MSKSLPMLPSLAGGSGVAAHALTDNDLLWMVDASTLDADRDRKVTLGELRALLFGSIAPVVDVSTWTASAGITFTGTTRVRLYPDNSIHIYIYMLAVAAPFSGTGTVAYVAGDVFGLAALTHPIISFDFIDAGITNTRYRGMLVYNPGSDQTRLVVNDSVLGVAASAQVVVPRI